MKKIIHKKIYKKHIKNGFIRRFKNATFKI